MIMFNVRKGSQAIIVRNKKKVILIGGGKDNNNKKFGRQIKRLSNTKNSKLISILVPHNHRNHLNVITPMLEIKDDKEV